MKKKRKSEVAYAVVFGKNNLIVWSYKRCLIYGEREAAERFVRKEMYDYRIKKVRLVFV